MNIHIEKLCVFVLLAVMLTLMVLSSIHLSVTYDEKDHLEYGTKILQRHTDRERTHHDSKMPFSALNAASFHFAKKILGCRPAGSITDDEADRISLFAGRFITMVMALALGLYVFIWSRQLYGPIPALFSLFLFVFSPNILAHARLATTDLYAALMVVASSYYFWKFMESGGWKRAAVSAFFLGLSQHAKFSCVFLYPIFLFMVLIKYAHPLFEMVIKKDVQALLHSMKAFLKYFLAYIAISILVINAGYLFHKSFTPLGHFKFDSRLFKTMQAAPALENIRVPLPYAYLRGLDMVQYHADTGKSFGNIYLLGRIKLTGERFEGFKGYFFYATLFKETLAAQIFIIIALIVFILNRKKQHFLNNELYLLFPVLFFTVYLNYFYKAHIGLRFLVPVFPLLYIFCGNLLEGWQAFHWKWKSAVTILCIYLMVSSLSYFPHYLSYFNELVWNRKQAYKILADSNIDWGQNEWYLRTYLQNHPETILHPPVPTTGRIVVSVNKLVGVLAPPEQYRWLRQNFEPADHIAYSYLIYEVTTEDLRKALQKQSPRKPDDALPP